MALRSLFLTVLTVLVVAAAAAHAETLIVDNAHLRAADANPGTREAPLRTISAAAKRAKPGDIVLVRPGIYREAVTLTVSGKAGQPIVFKSEAPGKAVVSGADPVSGWKPEAPGVWSAAIPDLKFNRYGNAEWVYVDGSPLERAGSRAQLLPGSFYLDFDPPQSVVGSLNAPAPQTPTPAVARRVFVAPEEGQDIAGLKVELARREGLFFAAAPLEDIHIVGFTIIHNADWARGKRALVSVGPRWRIEDNHILWASYQGLATSASNGTVVRNNLIEWCGDAAIGGGSNANLLVENNRFLYHNWRRFNPNHEGGISKWVYTVDSRVRGNEAAYFYGYGLWFDIANSGNVLEQNVVHDSLLGAGLFTEISWTDIIKDNVAFNNQTAITIGESPGTAVLRNIVFNNDVGIRMRGNYGRVIGSNASEVTAVDDFVRSLRRIPDLSPIRLEQAEAQYIIYWQGPKSHMSNNSVIWQNILFDNRTNYTEHRNYSQSSPIDPFVNNFSDHNLFWSARPEGNVTHSGGAYPDLAAWQKASGRDRHSTFADPRAPDTKLPEWAAAKRKMWDQKFRTQQEMQALKLGLLDSAMAAVARGRIFRAATVRPFPVSDPSIRAFLFDVDGERTLGVWTTQQMGRRYLRLDTGKRGSVTVENGYLARKEHRLSDSGMLDLPVNWVPTYVRSVGENVREVAGADLRAAGLSLPDHPVPLSATFVNDGKAPRKLTVIFSSGPGFTPTPAAVSRTLGPGEKAEIKASLTPDGSFRRGVGQARVEAILGDERITRVAPFSVGEGGGTLVSAAGRSITIDGGLDDWKALGESALVGVIADAKQLTGGDPAKWGGAKDLGARIYAAWGQDALYAAVVVTDDAVVPAPAGAAPWESDAIELFIDGRASEMQWQQGFTEGVYQIGVGPTAAPGAGPASVRIQGSGELQGLVTATSRTADGYVVEMKIPLTAKNFPAREWQVGRAVKLSLLVDDRDDPNGPRKTVFGWSASPAGRNHQDTSGWKTLVLEQ
jgi:hypothetical protein